MSVVDTKELAYDTLKTLSSSNDEDRSNDYLSFDNDDDEFYAPDSFSKFFDFIPDKEIEEAIERLREEKVAVESDESDESIGSNDSDAETEPTVDKDTNNESSLGKFLKKFVRFI